MPTVADFFRSLTRLPLTMLGKVQPGSEEGQFLAMEKLRAYLGSAGAHTRFLPFLDNFSNETADMRTAYRKMLLAEPAVKSALLSKVLAVAALDVSVQPATPASRDKQIGEFCTYALQRSKGGTRRLVQNVMIPGLMDGYSVCEKVWARETRGPWAGLIRLKAIKSKDTQRLYMEGDDFRNVTAVVDVWNARTYHPDNFLLWAHLPLFENPLGNSDFRAAYRPYWLMQTAWQLRAIAMERFGLPVLKGTYQEGSSQKASLEAALQLIRGQSWFTIPDGAKVEALELATRGTADFESAIADLRKEIYLAICGAFLFALEGSTPHGAGDTSIHQDTTELLQWALAAEVGEIINDQIIPDLVNMNFENADYPRASLGAVNVSELKAELEIDTGLQKMGLPLSQSELYERYHRTPPVDANDRLVAPTPPGPGGSSPSQADHADRRDDDDPDARGGTGETGDRGPGPGSPNPLTEFCGGPGGKPGPCPAGGDSDDSAPAKTSSSSATELTPQQRQDLRAGLTEQARQVADRVQAIVAQAGKKGASIIAGRVAQSRHVAPIVAAFQEAGKGQAAKQVAKEAAKVLGKSVVERVTGFSKTLWDDVKTKHGPAMAVAAQSAYIALNKTSGVVELATGAAFIPGVRTARAYAVYYGVSYAVDGVAAAAKGAKKAANVLGFADEPAFDVYALAEVLRGYDRQLAEAAGMPASQWSDQEIFDALAESLDASPAAKAAEQNARLESVPADNSPGTSQQTAGGDLGEMIDSHMYADPEVSRSDPFRFDESWREYVRA